MTPMQKKAILEEFLSLGTTRVVVNGTHPLIKLPEYLLEDYDVHLDLSYDFGIHFPMSLEDDGIQAVLSFNRSSFLCFIPWDALWLARVQEGSQLRMILFPESVPSAIQRQVKIDFMNFIDWKERMNWSENYSEQAARRQTPLKVIEGGTEEEISPPRTDHLRLVK